MDGACDQLFAIVPLSPSDQHRGCVSPAALADELVDRDHAGLASDEPLAGRGVGVGRARDPARPAVIEDAIDELSQLVQVDGLDEELDRATTHRAGDGGSIC